MAFVASGPIGATLETIQENDGGKGFELGNTALGSDGKKYVLVEASAAISALAAGREVTITEPAFTAATGTGGFRAPPNVDVASGERFWAMEKNLGNGT